MMDEVILKGSPTEIVSFYQYPLPRYQYCKTVGEVGEHTVAWVFQTIFEEENVVIHSSISANGADIQIPSLSIGIEVWNWCSSHAYQSRARDVVKNLSSYKHKILVTSFLSESMKQYFDDKGVFLIQLNYQLIPRRFLEWYTLNQSMHKKKVNESRRTRRILFNKIISALLQIGVLSNTYTAHVCDSVSDLSSSPAHVCNTLSDVCNSLSHVSFDSVNADFNMDKSCIVEGKSSEITSLSSENAHRTNHSIDRSREGRNIVQVFREEIEIREKGSVLDEFLSYHLKRMNEIWEEIKRKEKLDWKGIRHKYYRKRGYFPDWYDYHKYLILKPSKTIFCSTRCYKFERCEKVKILGYYRWLVGELIKRGLLPKSHDDDFKAYYHNLKVKKRDYDSYNLEMMKELELVMSKVSFWLSFKIPMCIYAMENIVLPAIEEKKRKRKQKRKALRTSKVTTELEKWIWGE